ncbi:MAG TPA: hypothetical protein ENJ42_01050, partial [Hellea balneolensis]|nr:hypothetical protein [Hellea balneolensis]
MYNFFKLEDYGLDFNVSQRDFTRLDFKGRESETYRLSTPTDFNVTLADVRNGKPLFADDYAGDITTTGTISPTSSASGVIEVSSDSDWFKFSANDGDHIQVSLTASTQLYLSLYDNTGTRIFTHYGGGYSPEFFITPEYTGDFFLSVSGGYYSTPDINYTLDMSLVGDDYAGDTTTSGTITPGSSVNGLLEFPYDQDWFAITANAGDIYRIEVTNPSPPDYYINVYLYDALGNAIAPQSYYNSANRVFIVENPGTYFAAIANQTASTNFNYAYTLELTQIFDDYTDDISTTGTLSLGGTASGTIDWYGDSDWLAIDLVAGEAVHITLTGAGRLGYITPSSGGDLGYIQTTPSGQHLYIAAPTSGTYFVRVNTQSFGASNTYSLSAETITDDYLSSTATTGVLTLGSQVTANIDYGYDQDWFAFSATAGETVFFEAGYTDGNPGPARVGIYDGNGNLLVEQTDYQPTDGLIYTFATAGTYYISLQGARGDHTSTRTNTLIALGDIFTGTSLSDT